MWTVVLLLSRLGVSPPLYRRLPTVRLTLHFAVEPTCPCCFNGELIAAQRELLAFWIVKERVRLSSLR